MEGRVKLSYILPLSGALNWRLISLSPILKFPNMGDQCAAMGDDCHGYGFAILMTSGITCALLVFDIATRFFLRKKEDEIDTEFKTKDNLIVPSTIQPQESSSLGIVPNLTPERSEESLSVRTPSTLSSHLNDLLETLRANVDVEEETDLPPTLRQKLKDILSLKDNCSAISSEFDQLSTNLVRPPTREDENSDETLRCSLQEYQKRAKVLRSRWNLIRKLFFCADVHLRNATNYQNFYSDIQDVQTNLRCLYDNEEDLKAVATKPIANEKDYEKASEFYQKHMDDLLLWQTIVGDLCERSQHIVPVYKRTEACESPIAVTALCSYSDREFSVKEGENLILIANENDNVWTVRNSLGDEGSVPPVVCLIPPPDTVACNAVTKVKQNLTAVSQTTESYMKRILKHVILYNFEQLSTKEEVFKVIKKEKREELTDILAQFRFMAESSEESEEEILQYLEKIEKLVKMSAENGSEIEALDTQVIDVLTKMLQLLNTQENLQQQQRRKKESSINHATDDSLSFDSDWDILDEIDSVQKVGISVEKSTTEVGESSSLTSAKGEVRQTFSIRGVLDPRDNTEISMDDAVARGIIDHSRGVYCNLLTQEEYPLPVAMNAGFILVESTETQKSKEETQAVGVVKVKVIRETRPYSIITVLDPNTNSHISVADAIDRGIFDSVEGAWHNQSKDEVVLARDAIDMGYLSVEYEGNERGDEIESEVIERTFAIYGVLDKSINQRISFKDAIEKGLIDQDAGLYFDHDAKENINVTEAMGRGWVKARAVTGSSEVESFMSKTLSASSDSLNSGASM